MKKYDIAAYIWPAFTGREPRTKLFWPKGIGEWESIQSAEKKFPEHSWPRRPLWGYVDEADPAVMEMEINEASRHGVNVFIYDWYWFDDRPFLENCLNDGFLKAHNNDKMKFYLMWANHNATTTWRKEIAHVDNTVLWQGTVDRPRFERVVHRVIKQYFSHPSYYQIEGKPVFMIYDFNNLVQGLGGAANTKKALDWFREETVKAGFPGLHLQLVAWGGYNLTVEYPDEYGEMKPVNFEDMPFDSITNYQYAHYVYMDMDYLDVLEAVKKEYARVDQAYHTTYFPHVSVGWDNNPRFVTRVKNVARNNTPENFEKALRMAKEYVDTHDLPAPLITVNSWNEWAETSYLEPDDLNGYGYLEAVKRVFMDEE